jgi:hypothetical protein
LAAIRSKNDLTGTHMTTSSQSKQGANQQKPHSAIPKNAAPATDERCFERGYN